MYGEWYNDTVLSTKYKTWESMIKACDTWTKKQNQKHKRFDFLLCKLIQARFVWNSEECWAKLNLIHLDPKWECPIWSNIFASFILTNRSSYQRSHSSWMRDIRTTFHRFNLFWFETVLHRRLNSVQYALWSHFFQRASLASSASCDLSISMTMMRHGLVQWNQPFHW